jgi:uncharacterized protein (TIGR02145 family)
MKTKIGLFLTVFALLFAGCKKDPIMKNETGTFQDARDGNVYQWVKIGGQVWMAENLAFLPSVNKSAQFSKTSPYYYVYGYEGEDVNGAQAGGNYATYGVLYNWPAAMAACPTFWRLPSHEEWTTLTAYLGGGQVAGAKMQEAGTSHWEGSTGATNESGFTALPAGVRSLSYGFLSLHELAQFWTATEYTEYEPSVARYWVLTQVNFIEPHQAPTSMGNSVRCIQN